MCIGCHGIKGYQASFPEIHKVPMIAGQGAKYIVAALTAYKKGERKHPAMRGIAASLSDQDMADLACLLRAARQGLRRAARAGRAGPGGGRRAADQGRLRVLPRGQLQQADRRTLPQTGRPARRLPVRRAEGLQDRGQPAGRPRQPDHGRSGQAVQQCRAEGVSQLHRVAAERPAHRAAGQVPLNWTTPEAASPLPLKGAPLTYRQSRIRGGRLGYSRARRLESSFEAAQCAAFVFWRRHR